MTQFKSKPVVVDAVQVPLSISAEPEWVYEAHNAGMLWVTGDGVRVKTNHGVALARNGDWIIRAASGEVYPCNAATFAEEYEPV